MAPMPSPLANTLRRKSSMRRDCSHERRTRYIEARCGSQPDIKAGRKSRFYGLTAILAHRGRFHSVELHRFVMSAISQNSAAPEGTPSAAGPLGAKRVATSKLSTEQTFHRRFLRTALCRKPHLAGCPMGTPPPLGLWRLRHNTGVIKGPDGADKLSHDCGLPVKRADDGVDRQFAIGVMGGAARCCLVKAGTQQPQVRRCQKQNAT